MSWTEWGAGAVSTLASQALDAAAVAQAAASQVAVSGSKLLEEADALVQAQAEAPDGIVPSGLTEQLKELIRTQDEELQQLRANAEQDGRITERAELELVFDGEKALAAEHANWKQGTHGSRETIEL